MDEASWTMNVWLCDCFDDPWDGCRGNLAISTRKSLGAVTLRVMTSSILNFSPFWCSHYITGAPRRLASSARRGDCPEVLTNQSTQNQWPPNQRSGISGISHMWPIRVPGGTGG